MMLNNGMNNSGLGKMNNKKSILNSLYSALFLQHEIHGTGKIFAFDNVWQPKRHDESKKCALKSCNKIATIGKACCCSEHYKMWNAK